MSESRGTVPVLAESLFTGMLLSNLKSNLWLTKLIFVAITLERLESNAKIGYRVQPVGVSRCCCTSGGAFGDRSFFYLFTNLVRLALCSCCSCFCFSRSVEGSGTATENPYEPYRVGGIPFAFLWTYSARMECFLNVPTNRAGVGR